MERMTVYIVHSLKYGGVFGVYSTMEYAKEDLISWAKHRDIYNEKFNKYRFSTRPWIVDQYAKPKQSKG